MLRLSPLILAACVPLSFSGSNVPTDHTFTLTNEDIAAAESDECAVEWITDDAGLNRDQALSLLDDLGVRIVEREVAKFTTATPRRLFVGKGFSERPIPSQATTLTHELVHYCQMDASNAIFVKSYAHSAGRWRIEVPAFSQSIRTMIRQGESDELVSDYIDAKLVSMRDFYFLWDIDQAQYEMETRRIWESQH
jgi:hypothetical protein